MKNCLPHGLYAITAPRYRQVRQLLAECEAALSGGASLLQYRDKSADEDWQLETAARLNSLCERYGVPLIINDDIGLAARVGAAGVHLGRVDASVRDARAELGPDCIIGASCYNQLKLAQVAADDGASYLAFGSMFPSHSKPDAVQCPVETLRAAGQFGLPLVAIGGITVENGPSLVAAGASYLAVIAAVFDTPDVHLAAKQFSGLWPESRDVSARTTH